MVDSLSEIQKLTDGMEVIEPSALAEKLAKNGVIKKDQETEVVSLVMGTPASMFIYDGVRLFLQKVLYGQSDVILWSQGDPILQKAKCETSGLLQLGEDTHGTMEIAVATDKIQILEGLLTPGKLKNKKRIIIIDDKSVQLFRTYQELIRIRDVEHRELPADIMYVWMRKDPKTRNIYPDGFPTKEELTRFIQGEFKLAEEIDHVPILANSLYLIDFDRTLFNTDKWFGTVQERIATEVCRQTP